MKTCHLTFDGVRDFTLSQGDKRLAKLAYAHWYAMDAVFSLDEKTNGKIQSSTKNVVETCFEVKSDENVHLYIHQDWRGKFTLHYTLHDCTQSFTFVQQSSSSYQLNDAKALTLAVFEAEFHWKSLSHAFTIKPTEALFAYSDATLLLMACSYCVSVMMQSTFSQYSSQ